MGLRELSKQLQTIAEEELNEVPSRRADDIVALIKWIDAQPYLNARTEEQWLLSFLRVSKFSLEKAKTRIEKFYSLRSFAPEVFQTRDPYLLAVQAMFKDRIGMVLPIVNGEPVRVIFRVGTVDTETLSFESRMKIFAMILDFLLWECDEISIAGLFILFDGTGVTYKHLSQVTLPILRKCVTCFVNAYPIRIKGMHVIHVPSFAMPIINLGLQLLPQKVASVAHFYSDDSKSAIHKDFPAKFLPVEYGGYGQSMSELSEQLRVKMESYKDWYLNDEIYSTIESKRPKDSPLSNELFGLDGSFRKLEVD